jgi:MerR family transcriptional regulator, light-induced transcriptional regulator
MPSTAVSSLLSIGDICFETGLSPDVVRVWERRYGFPTPVRLPSGHRRYRKEDLNRLRLLTECVASGHRPSKLAGLGEEDLKRLLVAAGPATSEGVLHPLLAAVGEMDSSLIRQILQDAHREFGLKQFLSEVVAPLLDRVGMAWAEGSIGVHQEHLLTEILEDMLRPLRQSYPPNPSLGTVLLATLPGERHRLGLLMVALLYASRGFRVELLGVDTPVASIAGAARTLRAAKVAVSLSIQSSGEPTRRLLMDLQERLPQGCALVIGGQGAARTRKVPGVERIIALDVG